MTHEMTTETSYEYIEYGRYENVYLVCTCGHRVYAANEARLRKAYVEHGADIIRENLKDYAL